MEWEEIEKQKRKERIDPHANPLTSFGRDDVFTDKLKVYVKKRDLVTSIKGKYQQFIPGEKIE